MHGETSVGEDPTPPIDPVPAPAPAPPSEGDEPGLDKEEPEFVDEPDLPQEESSSGPTERQPGSGPR